MVKVRLKPFKIKEIIHASSCTKSYNSGIYGKFYKKISQYLHDCIREEVKSSTFRNLKGDKDNKWVFLDGAEKLFTEFDKPQMLDGADSFLTELMVQSDMSQKRKIFNLRIFIFRGKKRQKPQKQ